MIASTDVRLKDGITNSGKVISYAHHEIHGGSSFRLTYGNPVLDDTDDISISFKTPASGPNLHVVPIAQSSAAAYFDVLEGPTVTVDSGTIVDVQKRYRGHSKTSQMLSLETSPQSAKANIDATITADGTNVIREYFGAGGPKIPGASRDLSEWILEFDTIYSFRLTSTVNGNVGNLDLIWYEHTNVGG